MTDTIPTTTRRAVLAGAAALPAAALPAAAAEAANGTDAAWAIYTARRAESEAATEAATFAYDQLPEDVREARRAAHFDPLAAELRAKRVAFDARRQQYDQLCEASDRAGHAADDAANAVLAAPVLTLTDVRRVLEIAEVHWLDCGDLESQCALAALDGLRAITGADPLA